MGHLLRVTLLVLAVGSVCAAEPDLVAHWTFDEGSGDVAADVTGNGHDAALRNVEWVASPRGHALRFDSKEDLAQYGGVDTMNLSGDASLVVWVKTDASVEPKTNRILFGDGGLGVERNMNLRMDGYGYLRFEWADGKGNASLLAPSSLLNGAWKQVAVVADCKQMLATMYVDGEPVANMPMPLPISRAPVKERLTGWFYNGYFQGELDDIRLYSRALSEAEVKALHSSEADVEVGSARLVYDPSGPTPMAVSTLALRNWSKEPRRVSVSSGEGEPVEVTLEPGARTEVAGGKQGLKPVWTGRSDLFLCEGITQAQKARVITYRGESSDVQQVPIASQLLLEPISVTVHDPWQAALAPGQTERIEAELKPAVQEEQLQSGTVTVRLVSRETGHEAVSREFRASAAMAVSLDVRSVPWGAYDLVVVLRDESGRDVVSARRPATILPGGAQQIRVLNNLVSELCDARARGLLDSPEIEFMNPRDGWVWFSATGRCGVDLGDSRILSVETGQPAAEAMRQLPAGRHRLRIQGTPTDLRVRAIPGLLYNVYPSTPQIKPFGSNTWERLSEYTLANTNMIEGQVIGTPEYTQWRAQGRMWIANLQAPGLIDKETWTPEKLLEIWRKPRNWDLEGIDGIQVDEYYPGNPSTENVVATALSIARLSEDPAFSGKLWIPFVVNMHGNPAAELFMRTTLGSGWPFSVEVYAGEEPTEERNLASLSSQFSSVARNWDRAYTGAMRRAIFTPMYAYLPYCTTNRYPQADFRVHLDMQMQLLATDPGFFGLWGVQPYRSNYVDEEILNCMARLLRHYCIEGKTDRMLSDPYELAHVADPDFEEGTDRWQTAPAADRSITAGSFAGYGTLQGRYPGGTFGDTFLLMTRSAEGANVVSQELKGLQAGRLYSLKLITGDYGDLSSGKSREDTQVVSIGIEGAQTLDGGFSYPFRSARGPAPFSRESPFWMTYHWLQFRAQSETAEMSIRDWQAPDTPGGPVGQQVMYSFVEVQPVLE